MTNRSATAAANPLLPNHPRLRFITEAPEGAAGAIATEPVTAPVTAPAVPTPPASQPSTASQPVAADQPRTLADWTHAELAAELTKTRGENADRRVAAKAAETANAQFKKDIAAAIGFTSPDSPEVTVESLTKSLGEKDTALAARDEAIAKAARENAIWRGAALAGVDPVRLLDSKTFDVKFSTVDPLDTAAVTAAVKEALSQDASLASRTVAPSSGSSKAQGNGDTSNPKSMSDAVASRMGFK